MSIPVTADRKRAFALIDTLLPRWQRRQFPFNQPGVMVPQELIPKEVRDNPEEVGRFYFFVCIYMRGGIRSDQAFRAILKMRDDHPHLFDPFAAAWEEPASVQHILKQYIGWDSETASKNWVLNARHLETSWGGSVIKLFKGIRSYEEALHRLRNKTRKKDQLLGPQSMGFRGFQEKMVSMLVYFMDWNGLLSTRFAYPTPADFHNFRLAFAHGALKVSVDKTRVSSGSEIAGAWREITLAYIRRRKANPVEVADALWLFSLLLCGRSPLTETTGVEKEKNGSGMFALHMLPHHDDAQYMARKYRKRLEETCLRCPVLETCGLVVPAGPYYGRRNIADLKGGMLHFIPRPEVERYAAPIDPDIPMRKPRSKRAKSNGTQHSLL